MASTKPPYEEDSSKKHRMDSATAGNRCEGTGWAEKVTASNSVRSVYLSLTTHLIVAIILTLWAISPESQSSRLSPVIIDFGTESEQEWGETNGDDNTATLLTEADEKDDPLETSEERSDSSEEEVTAPDENQTNQQMQTADPNKEMAPDSPVSEKTATKAQPSLRQVKPKEQQDNKKNDMQRGGGSRATASSADAKVALSQRSGAARGETARARGGSPASEAAIERGLLWLARHQAANGAWLFEHPHCIDPFGRPSQQCLCRTKGYIEGHTKASTSIALLPFLGAGNTHLDGPYKEVVYRGLEQLKTILDIELKELHPDNPNFVSTFSGDLYGYGLTTLVMAEAFGMTGDPDLERYVNALTVFPCTAPTPTWRVALRTRSARRYHGYRMAGSRTQEQPTRRGGSSF
jgi:outer membrane biosynthesis protein TonB